MRDFRLNRLPLLVLALLVPAGLLRAQATETNTRVVLEEIVARVNNEIITLSDLGRSRQLLRRELGEKYRGAELEQRLAEDEPHVLRDLIDQSLLAQRGADLGLSVEPEVIKRLDRIRQEMNLPTMEELERAVAAQGMAFEDFRQQLRSQILTSMVVQREVSGRVMVDDEEVRHYYLQHRGEFAQPERVRLREILVSTEKVEPDKLAEREARVQEVLAKIRQGEKFEELARTYSDAPTTADGGELGYFEPEKLAPTIREVIGKLREGAVSDPLRTPQGFLILQLVEHTPAGVPPFERAEPLIREKLFFDRVQPALREYLSNLRREAYVYVKSGYVDTGAVEPEPAPVRRGSKRRRRERD